MLEFQLFRIRVYPSPQLTLFGGERSPSEILAAAIRSHPSAELRRGMEWHVGNVVDIDERGLYFRVGRSSRSRVEVFEDGNFIDQEFEMAPYTHAVLDLELEVCALAKKARLAPKTTGIANQLARLLRQSGVAGQPGADFEIAEIQDPQDFITHLQEAVIVSNFWITFSRPNPFDAEEDFQRPSERLLKGANGDKGKTEICGENLERECLQTLAHAAAASGNDAGATMIIEGGPPKVRKRLKGHAVVLVEEELSEREQMAGLLHRLRLTYLRIRGNGDESQ